MGVGLKNNVNICYTLNKFLASMKVLQKLMFIFHRLDLCACTNFSCLKVFLPRGIYSKINIFQKNFIFLHFPIKIEQISKES